MSQQSRSRTTTVLIPLQTCLHCRLVLRLVQTFLSNSTKGHEFGLTLVGDATHKPQFPAAISDSLLSRLSLTRTPAEAAAAAGVSRKFSPLAWEDALLELEMLLTGKRRFTEEDVWLLLARACDPETGLAFHPSVVKAFYNWLRVGLAELQADADEQHDLSEAGLWFTTAVAQLSIYDEASNSGMAKLLLGSGKVEEEMLR